MNLVGYTVCESLVKALLARDTAWIKTDTLWQSKERWVELEYKINVNDFKPDSAPFTSAKRNGFAKNEYLKRHYYEVSEDEIVVCRKSLLFRKYEWWNVFDATVFRYEDYRCSQTIPSTFSQRKQRFGEDPRRRNFLRRFSHFFRIFSTAGSRAPRCKKAAFFRKMHGFYGNFPMNSAEKHFLFFLWKSRYAY